MQGWEYLILRYYVADNVAAELFPQGVTRANIQTALPPEQRGELVHRLFQHMERTGVGAEYREDISEYATYLQRAQKRIDALSR